MSLLILWLDLFQGILSFKAIVNGLVFLVPFTVCFFFFLVYDGDGHVYSVSCYLISVYQLWRFYG